jgi:hypothetical protein
MSQKQTAHTTHVTAQQVLDAMAQAIVDLKKWTPTPECLMVLLSQSAFETGWWAAMWNNNLGNYKAIPGGATDWCFFSCNELVKVVPEEWKTDPLVQVIPRNGYFECWFKPEHHACCFMSFPTLAAGAEVYLKKLCGQYSAPQDCGPSDAWYHATQGDVAAFCHALKQHGYYTDGEQHYTNTVLSVYQSMQKKNLDFSKLPAPVGEIDLPPILIVGDPEPSSNT